MLNQESGNNGGPAYDHEVALQFKKIGDPCSTLIFTVSVIDM